MFDDTIPIPRRQAGMVMQALERDAKELRKQSMRRSNGGPHNADVRKRLRDRATAEDVLASSIRARLHATGVRAA